MTATDLVLFVSLLVAAGFVYFLAFSVVPSIAQDRFVDSLCGLRALIRQLDDERPGSHEHPGVVTLDAYIARTLRFGRPLGLSHLAAAFVQSRRAPRPRHGPPFDYRGLSQSDRIVLRWIERQFTYEIIRATLMGSRLWVFTLPLWLLARAALRPHIAARPRESTAEAAEAIVLESLRMRMVDDRRRPPRPPTGSGPQAQAVG